MLATLGDLLPTAVAHPCRDSQVAESVFGFLPGRRGGCQGDVAKLMAENFTVLPQGIKKLREEEEKPACEEKYLCWTGPVTRNTRPGLTTYHEQRV